MEIRITYTFCDNCNVVHEVSNPKRSVFVGTFKKAEKEGWAEADYGHACPRCVQADAENEGNAAGLGDLIAVLKTPEQQRDAAIHNGGADTADYKGMNDAWKRKKEEK